MFGEITLFVVLQGAALIAAGAVAGYFTAVQRFDKQRDKLRDELEAVQNELKEHREQVDSHFLKTGQLFNQLTDSYREIYEHLATGAQNLCSTEVTKVQLAKPETRVLPVAAAVATTAAEAASDNTPPANETAAAETGEAEPAETAAENTTEPAADRSAEATETAADNDEQAAETSTTAAAATETEGTADTDTGTDTSTADESPAAVNAADSDAPRPTAPAADKVAVIDEKTAEDENMGAEAAPAPELASTTTEKPSPLDQHRTPPSIH